MKLFLLSFTALLAICTADKVGPKEAKLQDIIATQCPSMTCDAAATLHCPTSESEMEAKSVAKEDMLACACCERGFVQEFVGNMKQAKAKARGSGTTGTRLLRDRDQKVGPKGLRLQDIIATQCPSMTCGASATLHCPSNQSEMEAKSVAKEDMLACACCQEGFVLKFVGNIKQGKAKARGSGKTGTRLLRDQNVGPTKDKAYYNDIIATQCPDYACDAVTLHCPADKNEMQAKSVAKEDMLACACCQEGFVEKFMANNQP